MIVTLTPNTGIDHTLQVPDFRLNRTLRAGGSAWGMGGKATDVSWILGKLGVPTRALGFAAGPNGARMEAMLRERGVETAFVQVDGETRLNTVLVVPGQGQSTITSSSLQVSPQHLLELETCYQRALEDASCVVLGGSLPAGVQVDFYAGAIRQANEKQIPVIFDSSGPSLAAGVKVQPAWIKPNLAELEDLLGYRPTGRLAIQRAAQQLHEEFLTAVIVTLGEEGAFAVLEEGSYFIQPLSIPVVSAAGAGDGVLAGLALACHRRESSRFGLQHGFALAGAILQTLATADFHVQDYEELLPRICILPS